MRTWPLGLVLVIVGIIVDYYEWNRWIGHDLEALDYLLSITANLILFTGFLIIVASLRSKPSPKIEDASNK